LINLEKIFKNKIIQAGSWYTISNFLSKGLVFLTLPIFTRLLSTEDYGLVSLYTAWLSIFTIIIGLGLNESIRRARFEYETRLDEFVSSITFLSILLFCTFLVFIYIFESFFMKITQLSQTLLYLMIFQAFFTYIQNLAMTKFQVNYNYKTVASLNIITALVSTISSIVLIIYIFQGDNYLGKIIGDWVVKFFIGMGIIFIFLKNGKKFIRIEYWKYSLILGVPLVFHGLGLILNVQFDRIIINKYVGASANGIYSFAYQIGMIIQVLFLSIDQAWNPWFFEKFKDGEYKIIKSRANIVRNVFTTLYCAVLMLSPEIVRLFSSSEYWSGLDVVPLIFISYYFMFMYTFEVNVEYGNKKTHLIAAGTLLSAVINIILNLIFVPVYGYIAAAITTIISYYLLFLFHYFITSKLLKMPIYGFRFHLKSTIMVISITLYFYLFKGSFFMRLIGVFLSLFLLYLYEAKNLKINNQKI